MPLHESVVSQIEVTCGVPQGSILGPIVLCMLPLVNVKEHYVDSHTYDHKAGLYTFLSNDKSQIIVYFII